jgi:predicted transposase/invertase (TIGR01784 family)
MEQANKANRDMIAREREIERMREKAEHDEAQALYHAEEKGIKATARNMLKMDFPIDTIIKVTGLTREEIEQLTMDKTIDN